jgi:hypothetical protein
VFLPGTLFEAKHANRASAARCRSRWLSERVGVRNDGKREDLKTYSAIKWMLVAALIAANGDTTARAQDVQPLYDHGGRRRAAGLVRRQVQLHSWRYPLL